jgi:predicted DNA-binding transcriptional regulator YafY
MNRIDRLFHILLILQRKKLVRAADLADEFGVSRRTIYRDLAALDEMGVPLIPMPGEGYSLVEGFYMPPLSFSLEETEALFLGARMLAAQASGRLAKGAETATEKIAHVLPGERKMMAQRLVEIVRFYQPDGKFDLDQPYLLQLQQAIKHHQVVHLRYDNHHEITERTVEPRYLMYGDGAWYLNGYCRLRKDIRSFRLERIENLKILRETFVPRDLSEKEQPWTKVRVRFKAEVVRRVRERQHYGFISDDAVCENGDIVMSYHVHRLEELRSWLFGWGTAAEVLSPLQLREEIYVEAKKLVEMLT